MLYSFELKTNLENVGIVYKCAGIFYGISNQSIALQIELFQLSAMIATACPAL
jgi:hypothetical protein